MSEHTEGEWELDGIAVYGGRTRVCWMGEPAQCAGDIPTMCSNWEANARLIAASPDMLEALQRNLGYLQSHYESAVKLWGADDRRCIDIEDAVNAARAAIAKATGGGL